MTAQERDRIGWLLDELDGAVLRDERALLTALTGLIRRTVDNAHGAASHAPKRRGRRATGDSAHAGKSEAGGS